MTDLISSITVVLESDTRDDDVEATLQAIRQIKGVLTVTGNVQDSLTSHVAEMRVRNEIGAKLHAVVYPGFEKV